MPEEFYRIKRLPPYVFAEVNDLKAKGRAAGHDVIDLGMGNPDGPTPPHIVAKLIEAVQRRTRPRARDHRHSGLEGGVRQPRPGDHRARRHRAGAEPELPDPFLWL